jgi:hypothetical protein
MIKSFSRFVARQPQFDLWSAVSLLCAGAINAQNQMKQYDLCQDFSGRISRENGAQGFVVGHDDLRAGFLSALHLDKLQMVFLNRAFSRRPSSA